MDGDEDVTVTFQPPHTRSWDVDKDLRRVSSPPILTSTMTSNMTSSGFLRHMHSTEFPFPLFSGGAEMSSWSSSESERSESEDELDEDDSDEDSVSGGSMRSAFSSIFRAYRE